MNLLAGYPAAQEDTKMSVKMRQEVERKIAAAFVREAIKAGYTMTVDYGDGESEHHSKITAVLAAMFLGDDDRVYLYKNNQRVGWVWFVYGNDGWDVISDYTTNLENLMGPAQKISDHYAG